MSITNGYLTVAEANAYTGKTTSADPTLLEDVVESCSRMVDRFCGRHFYQVTASRYFEVEDVDELDLGPFNDLVSLTSLKVDSDGDGTYETTFTSGMYLLSPVGAASRAPIAEPFTEIELLSGNTFPYSVPSGREYLIEVTGVWGWPAVPVEVKQATRILVAEVAKLQDAPFGVLGNDLTGVQYAPRQMPNAAKRLLQPFVHPAHVGIG